ncbi:DNA topoisomerase-1 [Palleronia marisminoris]|uniref:DNA topoisomerase n=1 Tax=Palleronia marisminoris TaxID=315423 RepID=A0A1Y5SER1_9RHOB|nr:DNA topoisomerase IB [Palleronia marisminoris]SFG70699.1 DNA topoisomerase-1 [Palleronia marisminoris]SLN36001.1 Eukaryotic DNA topoisomerase I, catalytic core [Palleronia marisminoris]
MKHIRDLVYYPDSYPGISRKRAGRGWSYTSPDGTRIGDAVERKRLDSLAVPPAYTDVWICPRPDGHLQATGRDVKGRKQYRYHENWTAYRAKRKYADLPSFGTHLPAIRRRIRRDLHNDAGDRAFAIAAVLAMIDRLSLRVGHPEYAENGAFGATTLRQRHVELRQDSLRLDFHGKGGTRIRRTLRDKRLAQVLHRLDDLPGATFVKWVDACGQMHEVTSTQVNELLHEITGEDGYTAKTFRTWNGTVSAMETALREESLTIKAMAEAAAETLGNTPTIARNSYIHPDVIDLVDTPLPDRKRIAEKAPECRGLRIGERAVLSFLSR